MMAKAIMPALDNLKGRIANTNQKLTILIKLKVQVPMSLYSVDTVPKPLDAETYTGAK